MFYHNQFGVIVVIDVGCSLDDLLLIRLSYKMDYSQIWTDLHWLSKNIMGKN